MLYEKILIMGQTKEGKKFRPSDWAERLYYTVAEYKKNGRITFNPLVNINNEDQSKYLYLPYCIDRLHLRTQDGYNENPFLSLFVKIHQKN